MKDETLELNAVEFSPEISRFQSIDEYETWDD
jgi:hypothetical protein